MKQRLVAHSARAVAAVLILAAGLMAAPRAEAAQDPTDFVADLGNQAIQVMGPSIPSAQRVARFRQLFDRDFDLSGIARFVLGPYGRALTPAQQQEFVALFRESMAQAYSDRLGQYAGEPFRVTGSRQTGGETIVYSRVLRANGKPVEIDWHVAERGGRLVVTDVAVDGVSQKVTERNQVAGIIQRNGGRPDSAIAALRQQLAQSGAPMTGSSAPPPAYGR